VSGAPDAPREKVRIGIVGAGGIAKAYADFLPSSSTATCIAVADVNGDAATAMAGTLGCPAFSSADELAGVDGLEAVVLCTPPVTHGVLAERFADVGVHVLSEKPLAVNRVAAAEMAAIAERTGIVLTMATKFRFCDDVNRAALIVSAGRIGELRLVENAFTSRVDMSGRWNADPSISGGGVLMDNGTHSVDLVRHLLGPIAEVLAVETSRPPGFLVEDSARLHLRTESGIDAHVDLSWSIDKSLAGFLHVYGTLGEIRVGWRESAWRQYGDEWEIIGAGYAKGPAMSGVVDAFCRAVRAEAPLAVTVDDGIAAAACIDAAYESIRLGGWVKLADLGLDDLGVSPR